MLKKYTIKIISLFVLFALAPIALLMFIGKSSKVDIVANDYKAYADTPTGAIGEGCCEACGGSCCSGG